MLGLKLFDDPNANKGPTKVKEQEINLYFSLEELRSGCKKATNITRQKLEILPGTILLEKMDITKTEDFCIRR